MAVLSHARSQTESIPHRPVGDQADHDIRNSPHLYPSAKHVFVRVTIWFPEKQELSVVHFIDLAGMPSANDKLDDLLKQNGVDEKVSRCTMCVCVLECSSPVTALS